MTFSLLEILSIYGKIVVKKDKVSGYMDNRFFTDSSIYIEFYDFY